MATVGWGIVGIGYIVETTMAPAIVADPHCELIAGVSRDQGRADDFANKFGAQYAYVDYEEMLANQDVRAVFIATPNALHANQVVAAAQAGKHVLCEKPLATSVADASRVVEACRTAGVRLGINFHNRQLSWVRDTKELIANGDIGEVMTIHVQAGAGLRPPVGWRSDPELAGLGTIYSQGVHVFDFLRFILDSDPVEVVAMFDYEKGKYEVETQALVLLRFANGTLAYVNSNQSIPYPHNDIEVFGTRGRITGVNLTRRRSDGELEVLTATTRTVSSYPQPSGLSHEQTLAAYTEAVLGDKEPSPSGMDGLHSMLLGESIALSVEERRLVEIDYSELNPERASDV